MANITELKRIENMNKGLFVSNNAKIDMSVIQQDAEGYTYVNGDEIVPLIDQSFMLKIIQPSSNKNEDFLKDAAGMFRYVNADFLEEGHDTLTSQLHLLPIAVVRDIQQYFPKYVKGSTSKPICQSYDRLAPSPYVEEPQNHVCGVMCTSTNGNPYIKITCPVGAWVDGQAPLCKEHIHVAFFDLDYKCPVIYDFNGTAASIWRKLLSDYNKKKTAVRLLKKSIFDYMITVDTKLVTTYYNWDAKFEDATKTEYGNVSRYIPIIKFYIDVLFYNNASNSTKIVEEYSAEAEVVEGTTATNNIIEEAPDLYGSEEKKLDEVPF